MTCGPNAKDSEALIIVEGRNDVRNLLKFGINNAIATMGSGIKPKLAELASNLIEIQAKMHKIIKPQSSVDLPVDSCYLSKETGFIWHARKNMPDTDLNPRIKSMDWKGSQIR